METINITIKKDASLEYEVQGVKGKACKDLTKTIDEIAGKVLSSKNTSEYNERDNKERVHNRG